MTEARPADPDGTVERMARAMYEEADGWTSWPPSDRFTREHCRRLARAALAAARPPALDDERIWRCARCHRAPERHAGGREAGDCIYVPELVAPADEPAAAVEPSPYVEAWLASADRGSLVAECRRLSDVALHNLARAQTAEAALRALDGSR